MPTENVEEPVLISALKEDEMTICYEISRQTEKISEETTIVTTTYMCFTRTNGLGDATIFIGATN